MILTIEHTYRERLGLLIEWSGSQAELARILGKSSSQVSQWKNASKDSKTGKPRAMERQSAREIEVALNLPVGWMDKPIVCDRRALLFELAALDPQQRKSVEALLSAEHAAEANLRAELATGLPGPHSLAGEAHSMSQLDAYNFPDELVWEDILTKRDHLPEVFRVAMPDDALLAIPKGTLLVFERKTHSNLPRPGWGVLVEDSHGFRSIRRYKQIRGDHFVAEATGAGYHSFDSINDGLTILAIMVGKMDGAA